MRLFFWKPNFAVKQGVWVVSKRLKCDDHGRPISWPGIVTEVLSDRLRVFDKFMIAGSEPKEFTHEGDGISSSSCYYLAPDRGAPLRHEKKFLKTTNLP